MKDISEDNAAAIDIAAGAPTSARGDGTTDCAVVVLAGGAGTRFWPLSTQDKPKQFLTLLGDRSLLQTGYRLASLIAPSERISCSRTKPSFRSFENSFRICRTPTSSASPCVATPRQPSAWEH